MLKLNHLFRLGIMKLKRRTVYAKKKSKTVGRLVVFLPAYGKCKGICVGGCDNKNARWGG